MESKRKAYDGIYVGINKKAAVKPLVCLMSGGEEVRHQRTCRNAGERRRTDFFFIIQ